MMIDDKSISLSFFYGSKFDHQDMMLMVHIVPAIRTPAKKRRHRETHVCLCTSAFSSGHQSFPDFLTQVKLNLPSDPTWPWKIIILIVFQEVQR